ncbi:P1 protein [Chickpea chlorotic stunt virus]|uniref:p1 protein n=1 Tax=Chickpea chlorotic stunt virus TaxID=328430 RepID=Q17S70_9VIRU|nr:P1 protein [Chickpea chlorotic stunt virus]AAY90039.1 P1 protein [Chickpea chlorotic stunt virus]
MALTKVLAIALFCFCFHFFLGASSSLATNWSSPGMAGITAITGFSNDYLQTPGFVPYVYNLVEKPVTIPQSKLPLPELNYTDIFKVLWLKGYQDTRTCLVLAFTTSQSSLAHMYDNLSEITSACALRLSWAIVSIWTLVIWAFCSWMVRIITTHTMLIVAVGLLIACTVATAKLLHLIFGSFSVWIIVPVYRSLAFLWKLRSPKTVSNSMKIVKEKMTKGFGSYDMIMSPPKSCVLEMLHDDEQHCGYASCILLADGTVGLLTSYHVMEEAYWVKSNKTGNKIKTSDFRPLTQSQNADLSILVGPPNWQGLLGCSAAQYVTVKHLAAGDARIFYRKNGEWYSGVAKLVGPHKLNFVNVLSNTEPGFSGTPYFSGNKIVGVHTGGDEEENRNYMAAIPHLEGLTASKYIYETTAPKGRIFDEDLYQELLEEFSTQEARSIMKHKGFDMECSGKFKGRWVWIDCNNDLTPAEINNILSSKGKTRLESESPRFFEDAEEFYDAADSMELETSKKANLNGLRGADLVKTGKEGSTQKTKSDDGDTVQKVIEALVAKMNVQELEKQVISKVAQKVQKNTSTPPKKNRRRRGKRGGESKQIALTTSSPPSTSGKYLPPQKRPQGLKPVEKSPNSTIQSKNNKVDGERKSSPNTQRWVKKSEASAGQSSAKKLN